MKLGRRGHNLNIYGVPHIAFKNTLGSFGGPAIFRKYDFPNRYFFYTYDSFSVKLFISVPHKRCSLKF